MKTATSLVVSVIIATILDERFVVLVTYWSVVDSCQKIIEMIVQF